jgi:hypothetical protein
MADTVIRLATDADMAEVERWLKQEDEKEVPGCFYCNWEVIERGHEQGQVYVLPDAKTNKPIGFLLNGRFRPDILAVKADRRGEGHGAVLAKFMIDLWRRKEDACVIEIECAPWTSATFWQRMGFTLYREHRAYMLLPTQFDVPAGAPEVPVRITFFPEQVKYGTDIAPLMVATPRAIRMADGMIRLAERVFLFEDLYPGDHRDIVVAIDVDGREVYRDKAKYPEASDIGVQRHDHGWVVDEIWFED